MRKIISLFMLMVLCISISACAADSATSNNTDGDASKMASKNIYEDENISVDFEKITDSVVAGNFEIYIKVQNKTEKDITVHLKDVTINNSVIEVGSGVPCDIVAGANRAHGFFGRLDLVGINSADEATKITFKVWVVDDSFNTIITTTDLVIE